MKGKSITISLAKITGSFAEDKDKARDIRNQQIFPALERHETVILDFQGVDSATQSFIHALISEVLRVEGNKVLDKVYFKNCNEIIKGVINIVIEYMQEPGVKPAE